MGHIRRATPQDAAEIADAVISAGNEFLPWLFGRKYRDIIRELVLQEESAFSWSHAHVYEADGWVAGVVISYPSEKEKTIDAGMIAVLKKHFGFFSLLRFIRKSKKANKYFTRPADSYYIIAIAVFEEYRGRGIAGELLDYIEATACKKPYRYISLEVEAYNYSAIRTYQKHGFVVRKEVPLDRFSRRLLRRKDASMLLLHKELK